MIGAGQIRSVTVALKANIAGYTAPMAAAGAATKKFTADVAASTKQASVATLDHADKNRAAWDDLGRNVALGSVAIAAAAGLAVKGFADFDAQMSRVGAASNATAADMEKLRTAALQAGKDTKFSATEAAEAEEALVKAGVSVIDVVQGGLKGAMDLAAAGNLELADAADIAANAMNTFNLQGKDVPKIADALAAGAGKAVGDVGDLGLALKQAGLVASQVGLSMTDTVGTLSAFADNALLGSDAGTSFKTMLQRLNPQSDAAADTMKRLGLNFFDANGEFVGITEVAGQLQRGMQDLSAEQRLAAMTTIFGADAIRAANVLYAEGADGIARYVAGVNDQGYASRVAAKATDNLKGDLERLKGALETALIGSGGAGSKVLRELAQAAEAAVDAFDSLPGPVKEGLVVLGLLTGVIGLTGAAFLAAVPRIAETRAAMSALNVTAATTRSRLGGIARFAIGPWGAALAVGTIALGTWIERQHQAAEAARDLRDALDQQTGAMTSTARKIIQDQLSAKRPGNEILPDWLLIGEDTRSINERAKSIGLSLAEIQLAAEGNGPAMANLKRQMEEAFAAGDTQRIQELGYILRFLGDSANSVGEQRQALLLSKEAMSGLGQSTDETAASTAANSDELGRMQTAAAAAAQAEEDLKSALDSTNNAFLRGRDAQAAYEQSLDDVADALKANGRTTDVHTEKGRANRKALDDQAKAALGYLQSILDQQGPGAAFDKTLASTRAALIRSAEKFGMSKKAAREYADQILATPKAVATSIKVTGAAAAQAAISRTITLLQNLDGTVASARIVTTTVNKSTGGVSIRSGIARAGGGIVPRHLGSGVRDDVPALLTAGEYVVNRAATQRHRGLLEAINAGVPPRGYASGGLVAPLVTWTTPAQQAGDTWHVHATGDPQAIVNAAMRARDRRAAIRGRSTR